MCCVLHFQISKCIRGFTFGAFVAPFFVCSIVSYSSSSKHDPFRKGGKNTIETPQQATVVVQAANSASIQTVVSDSMARTGPKSTYSSVLNAVQTAIARENT